MSGPRKAIRHSAEQGCLSGTGLGRTAIYGGSTKNRLNLEIGSRGNRETHSDFLTTLSESSPVSIPKDLADTVEIGDGPISRDNQKAKTQNRV